MPTWTTLLEQLAKQKTDADKAAWHREQFEASLRSVSKERGGRNVIIYASGFLQKPQAPSQALSIGPEDINGFMAVMAGMDWGKGLTLILHTPGGTGNAAESIVAYLRSKFSDIEVVIPTYAMSAGTMIALAADRLLMGRQSQLGPIDAQLVINNRLVSAHAIMDQFETARDEILEDLATAHVWAPVLQSMGPALLVIYPRQSRGLDIVSRSKRPITSCAA